MEIEFPIGSPLMGVSVSEDREFESRELCLDEVRLVFTDTAIVLRALADTDEIEITQEPVSMSLAPRAPAWCSSFLGQKLQTVWVCQNSQGYQDLVALAFGRLHPGILFVSEGSVLKVFHSDQIYRPKTASDSLETYSEVEKVKPEVAYGR